MLERLNEIKKAALLMGMDYNTWSEIVINDRLRKHTFYIGWDNGYTDIQKKILKLCKDWKIQHMTILRPHRLIGEYGRVMYNTIKVGDVETYFEHNPKKIYKTLRELYNIHNENKFYWVETPDGLWHLYYIPDGYNVIHYGERDDDELIVMSNGQMFDVHNEYYFSIKDSIILRKMLKGGYDYWSPSTFHYDKLSDEEKETYYSFGECEE